jgi:hypothetical protein
MEPNCTATGLQNAEKCMIVNAFLLQKLRLGEP